jgi:hypothetical protein
MLKTLLFLLIFSIAVPPAYCKRPESGAADLIGLRIIGDETDEKYDKSVRNRILDNWSAYSPKDDLDSAIAIFTIESSGKIRHVQLQRPHGRPEDIYAAVDAILSTSPVEPVPQTSSGSEYYSGQAPGKILFDQKANQLSVAATTADTENFLNKRTSLRGKAVVLHIIPIDVLKRYPGIFEPQELHGEVNIVSLPLSVFNASLRDTQNHFLPAEELFKEKSLLNFYSDWEAFFNAHRSATKAEIVDMGQKMRRKYSNLTLKAAE